MESLCRRDFLKVSLVGGAFFATFSLPGWGQATPRVSGQDTARLSTPEPFLGNLGPFVKIHPDNRVTIGAPTTEMGQGVFTLMPLILAEEMDADWETVRVESLPLALRRVKEGDKVSDVAANGLDYAHAYQGSGGSQSTKFNYTYLREVGAQIRDRFLRAAAARWNLPSKELRTANNHVIQPNGSRLAYAQLLADAAALAPVDPKTLQLKPADQFKLIGKSHRLKEARALVTGAPVFGIDAQLPGMVHAVLARCPHFKGNLKSLDDSKARAVPGVREILKIKRTWPGEDRPRDSAFSLHGSVAVVADSLWSALKARNLLQIEWESPFQQESSQSQEDGMRKALQSGEKPRQETLKGDVEAELAKAARIVEAEYFAKPWAHACMEPHNALADMRGDRPHVISSHQFPDGIAHCVAEHCGYDPLLVRVDTPRIGTGFGRKAVSDFVSEAVYLSHLLKKPVKVTWTRDDEMACDAFNPASLHRFRAGLDSAGKLIAWDYQRASPGFGFAPLIFPYDLLSHYRARNYRVDSAMWYGAWRGPGHNIAGFAIQSFIDELAHATGVDPLKFQLELLGEPRKFPYKDYGSESIDTGRMARVLKLAAEKAGWGSPTPAGLGRGIACHFTFGSYCAHVVEVWVEQGQVRVQRVVSAVDCGRAVNRLGVEKQIQGGALDGLSTALRLEVNLEGGATRERNFDSYPLMRIADAPRNMEIHLVESEEHPSGCGEVGLPPFIPALTNAIFAATGKRIRRLPIGNQLS